MLPDFSVKELTKGKIQISWNNPYRNCIQLAIQRSADSSKNFRTIFSSLSPELATSGFVDNKPMPAIKSYYRIFYVLEGGAYFFTKSIAIESIPVSTDAVKEVPVAPPVISNPADKEVTAIYIKKAIAFSLNASEYKRFKDSINSKTKDKLHRINARSVEWLPVPIASRKDMVGIYQKDILLASLTKQAYLKFKDSIKTQTKDTLFAFGESRIQLHVYVVPPRPYVFIYRNDSLLLTLEPAQYKKFRDSVATRTKDTLFAKDNQHIAIHPFVTRYVWRPSEYVFTNTRGYVTILLPQVKQHRYHIVFYEEDGAEIFSIKTIKEPELILDKTDFVHAGWFFFELYEDDKLKEKNKFLLTRD